MHTAFYYSMLKVVIKFFPFGRKCSKPTEYHIVIDDYHWHIFILLFCNTKYLCNTKDIQPNNAKYTGDQLPFQNNSHSQCQYFQWEKNSACWGGNDFCIIVHDNS